MTAGYTSFARYRRSFRFGAVTLRPGMSVAEIGAALKGVATNSNPA
jgi:hypothetical protein